MNRIELMGRLTKDVEIRQTKNKTEVGAFTLAVQRKLDKETTDFIDCVVFGKLVDILTKYTKKGDRIVVCGELNINNYTDKEGNNKKSTVVIVNDFYFIEYKKEEEQKSDLPY